MTSDEPEGGAARKAGADDPSVPTDSPRATAGKRWPRLPLLALLIRSPKACRLLTLLLAAHFGLMLLGFSGWLCPILLASDRPCPGCGLSRSMLQVVRGNPQSALTLHAFGPVAALAIGLLVLSVCLGRGQRERLSRRIEKVEVATGISHVLLVLFLIYWAVRMVAGHGTISALA